MSSDNDRLRELASSAGSPETEDPTAPEAAKETFLLFRVGPRVFGADAHHVYEVVVSGSLTPIPTAPPYVLGIALVRGRLIPVISLQELLGFAGEREPAQTLPRLVVLRHEDLEVALLSDETRGICELDRNDVGASAGSRPSCIAGEVDLDGGLVFLLDVPDLLRSVSGEEVAA